MPSTIPGAPPFLRPYPPRFARTTGWLVVLVAAAALAFALAVPLPVAHEGRFTIGWGCRHAEEGAGAVLTMEPPAAEGGQATGCRRLLVGELRLAQSAFGEVGPGREVELRYDALPREGWGARQARLISIDADRGELRALFEASPLVVADAAGERSLGPGATGSGRIVLRHQTLFDQALGPLRARFARAAAAPARGETR